MEAVLKRDEPREADVIESQPWLTPDLITAVAETYVDKSDDIDVIAQRVNKDYWEGVLPGIDAPKVDGEGRIVADKRRPYAVHEIGIVLETDTCQQAIEALKQERQAERDEQAAERKRDQLARARQIKQARGERELVPLMYKQIEELTDTVEFLLHKIDQIGTAEGVRVARYLPEIPNKD